MQAGSGKQKVVWQHPEPVTDVHRGEQRCDASREIEVRKRDIKKFGQPNLAGHQFARIAGDLLGFAEVTRPSCRIAEQHLFTRSLRLDKQRTLHGPILP